MKSSISPGRWAVAMLVVSLLSACGGDGNDEVPEQQRAVCLDCSRASGVGRLNCLQMNAATPGCD